LAMEGLITCGIAASGREMMVGVGEVRSWAYVSRNSAFFLSIAAPSSVDSQLA
jgi:hypothetical protein